MNYHQYQPFPPVLLPNRKWPNRQITCAPNWCSVDLRDGNQALPDPMGIEGKLAFFDLLCRVGFKEIEIGFPASNETEFAFCRRLIEENRIPKNVTVQVLVPAREALIDKTVEALAGCDRAIIHLYNSTNPAQREIVFRKSMGEVLSLAVNATQYLAEKVKAAGKSDWIFQYSPESFSLTELEFALTVANYVSTAWLSSGANGMPMILNLPATVESATPNVFADQVEWMSEQIAHRQSILLSVHTHNDRGTGVAATELALLAGAQRVEGTLFGNGERTGNADIVTLALNLHTQGINPKLDLHDIPALVQAYEAATGMTVHDRHPYAGKLVLVAYSGSHQDAISKGMRAQEEGKTWRVPYLPINPADIGREYEAVIRINNQSGKGGVIHILEEELGIRIPKAYHVEIGQHFKTFSDTRGKEISPQEIVEEFQKEFVNVASEWKLLTHQSTQDDPSQTALEVTLGDGQDTYSETVLGNGPIHALAQYLSDLTQRTIQVTKFEEYGAGPGSDAQAVAYITLQDGTLGVGTNPNIETAALNALVCAANRQKNRITGPRNKDEAIQTAKATQPAGTRLLDPIEADPRFSASIAAAKKEAENSTPGSRSNPGRCHEVWYHTQELLEKRGIIWFSPQEMNPRCIFD